MCNTRYKLHSSTSIEYVMLLNMRSTRITLDNTKGNSISIEICKVSIGKKRTATIKAKRRDENMKLNFHLKKMKMSHLLFYYE